MLVKLKKLDYDSLKHSNLSQGCFEPLIKIYKNRIAEQTSLSEFEIKEQFYKQLTDGQRSLFMFYAYFNHVMKSPVEFFWWSAYFMAQPKSWAAIKDGLKYFDVQSMLLLVEKLEVELRRFHYPVKFEVFNVTREELELNKELQATFKSLYSDLVSDSSFIISKINKVIEKNLQQFIELEK